jgi:hypothetical protein
MFPVSAGMERSGRDYKQSTRKLDHVRRYSQMLGDGRNTPYPASLDLLALANSATRMHH